MEPIVIVKEATGDSAGVSMAGYDPLSGAWFRVSANQVGGRDPEGISYYMKKGEAEPVEPHYEPLPYFVGTILPPAILAAMHESPSIIRDVIRDENLWRITYAITQNKTTSPPQELYYEVQFDASSGKMLSYQRKGFPDQRIEFDLSDPRVEQPVHAGSGPTFKISFEDDVSTETFERQNVLSRMSEVRIRGEQKFSALAAGYTESASGEWIPPGSGSPTVPFAGRSVSRFRTPLILGGLLILALVLTEVIRRRSA